MTKEQSEVIKDIKIYIHDIISESVDEVGYKRYEISEEEQEFFNNIERLLNMLKEQDKEIEKKEKMIDLLLDFIYKMSIIRPGTIMYDLKGDGFDTNKCGYCKDKSCKDCIKQYFERKLEYGR
jgi:hypothetical protein